MPRNGATPVPAPETRPIWIILSVARRVRSMSPAPRAVPVIACAAIAMAPLGAASAQVRETGDYLRRMDTDADGVGNACDDPPPGDGKENPDRIDLS